MIAFPLRVLLSPGLRDLAIDIGLQPLMPIGGALGSGPDQSRNWNATDKGDAAMTKNGIDRPVPKDRPRATISTPDWLQEKVRNYYRETTEKSYLAKWSGESLALHFGISDESTTSIEDSLLNSNRYLANKARVVTGARVLDSGCGVGGSSLWLAKECGAQVTGVTIAPKQVELAHGFAVERGVADRVTFLLRDFMAVNLPAASFDVVWNIESLCHSADPRAYLEQVWDLVADGGRFACLDFFLGHKGDPNHARAMCDGWGLPALQHAAGLARMLEEIGFTDVETEDLTKVVKPSADALRQLALESQVKIAFARALGQQNPVFEGHVDATIGAIDGMVSGSVAYAYVGAVRPPRLNMEELQEDA
jgi:cyclopropane fatty-acyl-phospholipid synthase-like methyltransferase